MKLPHNDNCRQDIHSDYIDRLRQEWSDLEAAAEGIWDLPDKPKQ
jgi:hypothetical protein